MESKRAIYLSKFYLKDCSYFKEESYFGLINDNKLIQWTVIAGNNNTGKTNVLTAIDDLNDLVPKIEADIFYAEYNDTINPFIEKQKNDWKCSSSNNNRILKNIMIYNCNVTRKSLFGVFEVEEWLLQLDYASKNNKKKATENLDKIKELIQSGIFPEIKDFKFESSESFENYILFQINNEWHKSNKLGHGYQTMLSWIINFCKKMFEKYPDSPNPLSEPAILLIDELELHLHPSWQKKIAGYLTKLFPATQFIITTNSPFIIQSINELNLFILSKDDEYTKVHKASQTTFRDSTIEEILEVIMVENEQNHTSKPL